MKAARALLLSLSILLVLIFGAGAWLVASESGLRSLVKVANSLAGSSFQVAAVKGRLLGPLQLSQLSLQLTDIDLSIDQIDLQWSPKALWSSKIHINKLHIQNGNLAMRSSDTATEPSNTDLTILNKIAVSIDELAIQQWQLQTDEQAPFILDTGHLSAAWSKGVLAVKKFELHTPQGQLSAAGDLGLFKTAKLPFQCTVDWQIPTLQKRLAIDAQITGGPKQMQILLNTQSPAQSHTKLTLVDMWDKLNLDLTLELQRTVLNSLHQDYPPIAVSAHATAQGALNKLQAELRIDVQDDQIGHWQNRFTVLKTGNAWIIPSLSLTELTTRANLSGQAHIDLQDDFLQSPLGVELQWQALQWPIHQVAQIKSNTGHFKLDGTIAAYQLTSTWDLNGPELPTSSWQIKGQGSDQQLTLPTLQCTILEGSCAGDLKLSWAEPLTWNMDFQAKQLNLGQQWPELAGIISMHVQSEGSKTNATLTATHKLVSLQGSLLDRPLQGNALISQLNDSLHFKPFSLRAGEASLDINGSIAEQANLSWTLQVPQLHQLLPEWSGEISSQGTLRGPLDMPYLKSKTRGKLAYPNAPSHASFDSDIDIDLAGKQRWNVQLSASDLPLSDAQKLDHLQLSIQGKKSQHQIQIGLNSALVAGEILAQGGLDQQQWQGQLLPSELRSTQLGNWSTLEPTTLAISDTAMQLSSWCWHQDQANICTQATSDYASDSTVDLQIMQLPLAIFNQLPIPLDAKLRGTGSATVNIHQKASQPVQLALTTELKNLIIEVLDIDESEPSTYEIYSAQAEVSANQTGVQGDLSASLQDDGTMAAKFSIPAWQLGQALAPDQAVAGKIDIRLPSLDSITHLIPSIENSSGALQATVNIQGSYARPQIIPDIHLVNASTAIIPTNVLLTDIDLHLIGQADGPMQLRGTATSDTGGLSLQGELHLPSIDKWDLNLTLNGNHFHAVNLPQMDVQISPELKLQANPKNINIGGEIHIPLATILLKNMDGRTNASADVIIKKDESAQTPQADTLATRADVQLSFGDKVRLKGMGFDGRLNGKLRIKHPAQGLTKARGTLHIVDGTYKAYGQNLRIDRGRLIYVDHPIDNPGLDVQAVRQTDDVVAGVNITGQLNAPNLAIFSRPAMNESDALAYLLLGRPLNQASGNDGNMLYNAASSMGLAGGTMLAERIGQRFGIDEVRVESNGGLNEAALLLGKYLSPKLYVRYTVGAADAVNQVMIRYLLTDRWTIETQAGTHSGVDLLYSIEK